MSSLCFARRIQASPKARAASFILRMPLLLCPTILSELIRSPSWMEPSDVFNVSWSPPTICNGTSVSFSSQQLINTSNSNPASLGSRISCNFPPRCGRAWTSFTKTKICVFL
jgi:hypothetical protein